MSIRQKALRVSRSLVLTSMLGLNLLSGTAHAAQFPETVTVPVSQRKFCSNKTMMPLAASNAVYRVAVQKFAASEGKARSVAENWNRMIDGRPEMLEEASYAGGNCQATFAVSTNDVAILEALTQSAFCDRPAAILTRVNFEGAEDRSAELSAQAHQFLLDAFIKRDFAVVDVSEQTDLFRLPIREASSCAYTGESANCEARAHSLSESILEILGNANLIIEYYNDENIRGEKYLPLAADGIFNFISIEISPARDQLFFTATANTYKVSDRDIAWAVPPQSFPMPTRRRLEADVLGNAFDRIAEKIATESALRCSGN